MKYLIYSDARTGSNNLLSLLGNTFNCKTFNEPLSTRRLNKIKLYLDGLNTVEMSITKSIIGELIHFIVENKSTNDQLILNIKNYLKENPMDVSNPVDWEIKFYKDFLNFDKIIILGRSNLVHSSISKIIQHKIPKNQIKYKQEGDIIYHKISDEFILNNFEKQLKKEIDDGYDNWKNCFLAENKFDNCVYVSYEGLYYGMDKSEDKLKNFLSIKEFKDIKFINPKNRNRRYV